MVVYDTYKDVNSIFKYKHVGERGDILPLKAFVMCKTELPSCFSCKIAIFWIFPLIH